MHHPPPPWLIYFVAGSTILLAAGFVFAVRLPARRAEAWRILPLICVGVASLSHLVHPHISDAELYIGVSMTIVGLTLKVVKRARKWQRRRNAYVRPMIR